MAGLWRDAFELGDLTEIRARYEASAALSSIASFRTNSGIGVGTGFLEKRFNQGYQTLVMGVAVFFNSATWSDADLFTLYDSAGNVQLTLGTTTSNDFRLWRGTRAGGTLLATSPTVTPAFTVYVELLATIHPTAGAYELRINEVTQFSASNANTRNGAYNDIQRVRLSGATGYFLDDFYIADTSAPAPLGYFWGNVKIEALRTSGNGDVIGWTKFNDSNYKNVDEMPHNSDTDYNYSSQINASDLFQMGNMSAGSGSVRPVQLSYVARKDDALVRATRPLLKTGGVVYPGSNDSLTTSYAYYYENYDQNPQNLSDWDISSINSVQVGYQTTS